MFSPSSTETLPSAQKPRMLVVCFDGTANQYGPENTNVVKFFAMLRKDCEDEQLCYYQTGIGTYESPSLWSPLTMGIAKLADEAVALYLNAHVMGGYSFLMDNYRNGDKISIFGFSRGAYTARALAGMLTKVGLLPKDNVEQVPFAWKWYTKTDATSLVEAEGFKKTFARSVEIDFLGVWETVASTGVIMSRDLPFTTNNKKIKTFRQALALDERRAKFVPTFWHIPEGASAPANGQAAQTQNGAGGDKQDAALLEAAKKAPKRSNLLSFFARSFSQSSAVIEAEIDPQEDDTAACDVKEVWFVGGHSDVGGGAVADDTTATLADITLRWMIREVVSSKCGIQLDASAMEKYNVHVSIPPEQYFSTSLVAANATASPPQAMSSAEQPQPSEQDEASDNADALLPLHDELVLMPLWWILEVIPLKFSWQDKVGVWHKKWELHMGRGRYKNDTDPMLFHETVRVRMNDASLKYKPKLKYTPGTEKYVW